MLRFVTTSRFEKDYKKMQRRNKDLDKLNAIIQKLINEEILDQKYRDHSLKGNFKDRRECHIEPDWLLVYKVNKKEKMIIFERTGSHSELFE